MRGALLLLALAGAAAAGVSELARRDPGDVFTLTGKKHYASPTAPGRLACGRALALLSLTCAATAKRGRTGTCTYIHTLRVLRYLKLWLASIYYRGSYIKQLLIS